MRAHLSHTAALVVLISIPAWAQTGPRFEVASVRPTATDSPGGVRVGFQATATQVRASAFSVKDLLVTAYGLRPQQIEGPDWIGQQRFDVVATIPDGVPGSQIPEMLQALLAERFQLKVHHETKDLPVYVLGVGKGGAKLTESAPVANAPAGAPVNISGGGNASGVSVDLGSGASFTFANSQLQLRHMTATQVAGVLTRFVDRPVVDQTGLTGSYDVTLDVTQDDYNAMLIRSAVNAGVVLPPQALRILETASPDTVSAPLQRFGLTFEARKAPLDVIVVDSASKTPTEN
jgi:uncharacterized protein (TIGR03435 family)